MVNGNQDSKDFSRRKFLKGGLILGAAAGLTTIAGGKSSEEVVIAFGKKELDSFPHELAPDFKRFDSKRTTFNRSRLKDAEYLANKEAANIQRLKTDNSKPGYTHLDAAMLEAGKSLKDDFKGYSKGSLYPWDKKPNEEKYEFASKEDAAKAIKKAAKFWGADLVGICEYEDVEKWVYDPFYSTSERRDFYDSEFPFKPKSVIVLAFEMDYEAMSCAPTKLEGLATGTAYSKMATHNYQLTSFITQLGYNAFGTGNDIAESIPLAIAAGLGEQGRSGLLLTYEYGPRVRISKVFTDMELAYDKPIEFGANKFCQVCKKCAYSCPSQSISTADDMTWTAETYSKSNHEGVLKYYINVETCSFAWGKVGSDCGVCIASCPYNKPDFWHHRITTALTATPLKPFLNEMDDLFGYGDVFNEQTCIDFWDLDSYAGVVK